MRPPKDEIREQRPFLVRQAEPAEARQARMGIALLPGSDSMLLGPGAAEQGIEKEMMYPTLPSQCLSQPGRPCHAGTVAEGILVHAYEIVLLDSHGNATVVRTPVNSKHLAVTAHTDGFRQRDLCRESHQELDCRAFGEVGVNLEERPARAHVPRIAMQLIGLGVLQSDGQVQRKTPHTALLPRLDLRLFHEKSPC